MTEVLGWLNTPKIRGIVGGTISREDISDTQGLKKIIKKGCQTPMKTPMPPMNLGGTLGKVAEMKERFALTMFICFKALLLLSFFAFFIAFSGSVSATSIGSCTTIASPGVYELTTDITDSGASSCINITSSDVVFDGQGYTIDGVDTGLTSGVYVYNSTTTLTNVTVENLKVTDWDRGIYYRNAANGSMENNNASDNNRGIYLYSSSNNNTLTDNTANSNDDIGIYLYSSSSNILTNNTANSNSVTGIYLTSSSNYNTITNNTASNSGGEMGGVGIYLISSSNYNTIENNTVSSNSYYGIYLYWFSNNNTIENNTASNNWAGIYLEDSSNNTITNNNANSNDDTGIYLTSSSNYNTLTDNNASDNGYGISLKDSSNNTLTNNTANSNDIDGISLDSSHNNILTNNTIGSNANYGIYLSNSNYTTIYNNFFNNTANIGLLTSFLTSWNTTKTLGTNIVGGPYLGGNYWAYPNGTGFSETCSDADGDGICDSSYTLASGNIDYLPLTMFGISSCTTITSPGVYTLTTDIPNSGASTCISITSSDVIFDGQGYTIDGVDAGSTYGVYVYNSTMALTNVTVENLKVTDWYYGVWYRNAQNGSITNNTASSNSQYGIYLLSSSNNTISNNTASSNTFNGIILHSSSNDNTLTGNNASSNNDTGIVLHSSSNYNTLTNNTANWNIAEGIVLHSSSNYNTLTNNTANSNDNRGIYLYNSSNYNTLTNNTANSNNWGISLSSSHNNTLTNNTASSNSQYGIYLRYSSDNNTITNNTASSNSQYGIYLYNSSNYNTITNNNASSNEYGIALGYSSNNNTLTDNTANSNSYGIQLISSSNYNTLANNTASSNDIDGIYLQSSDSNTLTENNASDNDIGIYLTFSSNNNTISNNTASSNNDKGIYLFSSSDNNTLTDNTASNNYVGIRIGSSNYNTLINNNASSNNGYGILLMSSSNYNTITNNNVTSNNYSGIYLGSSSNNNITNNTASDNQEGIYLESSSSNTITNNTANSNGLYGIYLLLSSNNILTNNKASSNTWYGIHFESSSDNTLINNTANSNIDGILFDLSSNNTLTNNTANSNTNHGIYLISSSNNTLTNNTVTNNSLWDFYSVSSSTDNVVNNLCIEGCSTGTTEVSFTSMDIAMRSVESPPSDLGTLINISKYLNITNTSSNSWIYIEVSYSEEGLGAVTESTLKMYRDNITTTVWDEVAASGVNASEDFVYANITGFSIFAPLGEDITPPTITVTSPQNATYASNWTYLNFTAEDPSGISWTGYSLDGEPNITSGNTTLYDLSEGPHNVTVYANDTWGNMNNSTVWFSNYFTLQDAIDNTEEGNMTIALGEYYNETCYINKSLTLTGENATIIGNGTVPVCTVDNTTNVTIGELKLQNGTQGIYIENSTNVTIRNSVFSNNTGGESGITVKYSSNCTIEDSTVSNNDVGIDILSSTCTIRGNVISSNTIYGIRLNSSSNNTIYHNNIVDNAIQSYDDNLANNDWYNTNLMEGNYWSDYTGSDDGSGTGKHAIAGDGIGDTDISHPSPDYDNYPFVYQSGWGLPRKRTVCSTGCDYETIQEAVDGATDNSSIEVWSGTYTENVNVNKPLDIYAKDGQSVTTVTASSSSDYVFEVTADNVNISGFTVSGATGAGKSGIYLYRAGYGNFSNNNLSLNERGIYLKTSSNYNQITNNDVISNNGRGIHLATSNNNTIKNNNIRSNSDLGIRLYNSYDNLIYNNYFDNSNNAWDNCVTPPCNDWNTTQTLGTNIIGGPNLGGNFWSDYTGLDDGSNGRVADDGIGDTNLPYNSNGEIQNGGDWLPLTTAFVIELHQGLNLVSLPLIPLNSSINEVLRQNSTFFPITSISKSMPDGSYAISTFYSENPPDYWWSSDDFTTLDNDIGYWFKVSYDYNLTVVGELPASDRSVPLVEGLDLVGWTSTAERELWNAISQSASDYNVTEIARFSASGEYTISTFYPQNSPNYWWSSDDFDSLTQGKGYWFNVLQNSTWAYSP